MSDFSFVGPSYLSRSIAVDGEKLINLYPELVESGHGAGRPGTNWALYGTPGTYLLCTLGDSPFACIVSSDQQFAVADVTPIWYAISGQTLFQIAVHFNSMTQQFVGTATTIGTVAKRVNTSGQLFPAQIIVLGPGLLFVVAAGQAWVAMQHGISTSAVSAGGSGYAVGDTGLVNGGLLAAVYTVTSVSGGVVTGYTISPSGAGYPATGIYTTTTGGTQPGIGTGLTINITAINSGWTLTSQTIPTGSGNFIQSATYIDGYCVVSVSPTSVDARKFYISGINDPTSWNALDFGTKEGNPDPLVAVFAAFEYLFLFGLQTTEVWVNTGNANFPFQRISGGGVIQTGLASPWTVAVGQAPGAICWLGTDTRGQLVAFMMSGLQAIRISNYAVEFAWADFDVTGASAYCYQEDGHYFYRIDFPIPNQTWVADLSTIGPDGKPCWHERAQWDQSSSPPSFSADRGRYHGFGFPIGHAVGDYSNGNVYIQTTDQLTYNGTLIYRLRSSPHVNNNEEKWQRYTRLRLELEQGTGASNPVFNLRISDDGGFTWGSYIPRNAGATGNYGAVIPMEWYRLGHSRKRCFEISTTAAVPQAWVNAYIETIPGRGV